MSSARTLMVRLAMEESVVGVGEVRLLGDDLT